MVCSQRCAFQCSPADPRRRRSGADASSQAARGPTHVRVASDLELAFVGPVRLLVAWVVFQLVRAHDVVGAFVAALLATRQKSR